MKRLLRIPEQLIVFSGFLIFFLCTLVANFSGPHDSIGYLNGIVRGNALFHQHHLLYHFVTHYWLVFMQSILPGIRDYYLVEAFSAIWGSASLTVVYSFFRNRFGLSVLIAAAGTTVIAFTYGVWFYSVNIEVYAPPMFFLLLALYILTARGFSAKDVWKAGLLHSMAILFHQIHILFSLVILYKLWEQRHSIPWLRSLIIYAGIGIVLVGGAYVTIGWFVEGQDTMVGFMRWLQGYAHNQAYWKPPSWNTFAYVATGFSHAFVGGHYMLRLPGVESYVLAGSAEHSLGDELFLARHIQVSTAIILTILSLLLAALITWLCIRFVRKFKTIKAASGTVVLSLLLTLLVYSVFFCFWEPEILEFWIFQTILLWLVLLGTLPITGFPLGLKPLTGILLISVSLFVINYFGSMRWLMNLEDDLYYQKTKPVKDVIKQGDAVLIQDGWILKDFLGYFTNAKVLEAPQADSQRVVLDNSIRDHLARGGKLYIYPEYRTGSQWGDTRYIDSLMAAGNDRLKVFNRENPVIFVIE